jgi:hypothetical protein
MFTSFVSTIKHSIKLTQSSGIRMFYNNMSTIFNTPRKNNVKRAISEKSHDFDNCKYCEGVGLIVCPECNGCGKLYFESFKETLCDCCRGFGSQCCIVCGGSGKSHSIF